MHLEGFRTALTKVINDYGRAKNIIKEKDANLTGDDIREGLTAVISVKLPDPQFEGQTKAKLGSSFMRTLVLKVVSEGLSDYGMMAAGAVITSIPTLLLIFFGQKRLQEGMTKGALK